MMVPKALSLLDLSSGFSQQGHSVKTLWRKGSLTSRLRTFLRRPPSQTLFSPFWLLSSRRFGAPLQRHWGQRHMLPCPLAPSAPANSAVSQPIRLATSLGPVVPSFLITRQLQSLYRRSTPPLHPCCASVPQACPGSLHTPLPELLTLSCLHSVFSGTAQSFPPRSASTSNSLSPGPPV